MKNQEFGSDIKQILTQMCEQLDILEQKTSADLREIQYLKNLIEILQHQLKKII